MLRAAAFLGAASALSYYLLYIDRQSALALGLVEVEGSLGIALAPMLGCAALMLFSGNYLVALFQPSPQHPPRRSPIPRGPPATGTERPAQPTFKPGDHWTQDAIATAKQIPFPDGARLTFDPTRPTFIHLHLEHAPPERCKRAIALLGEWIATVPTPPRVRISFEGCPEEGSPRHHQVSGALARHLPRADFKAISALDAVDVIFVRHDPRWIEFRESS